MSVKFRIILISAASLLALSACNGKDNKTASASTSSGIAATVNGKPISTTTVEQIIAKRTEMGQPADPESRTAIIKQLAMQMLLSEEATKSKLASKPEVLDQINMTKQSILANAYIQDYIEKNPVTDDMLKAEYEKLNAQMSGNEYKARHILVHSETEAKDIIAKLKGNVKLFDKLAKEKSLDQGSKVNGGDLGWFDPHGMVPEFSDAVAKLEKGKFSPEPVRTQFGFHVILLEDTRAMQPPPFEEVKDRLSEQMREQNIKKLLDDMMAKAKIEITGASAVEATTKAE